MFPIPYFSLKSKRALEPSQIDHIGAKFVIANPLMRYIIYPALPDRLYIGYPAPLQEVDVSALQKRAQLLLRESASRGSTGHSPSILSHNLLAAVADGSTELIFLGTGSACPAKFRNVTANLLMIHPLPSSGKEDVAVNKECNIVEGSWSLLLDVGEGTLGQLYRRYGLNLPAALRSLGCVHISHAHADHHMGLIYVLQERVKAWQEVSNNPVVPLLVIGPKFVQDWLSAYSDYFSLAYTFIDAECFVRQDAAPPAYLPPALLHGGISDLRNVKVLHCTRAYGVVIQHTRGWKLVFSGDTRPCPALVEAGLGASVLIHEATFDDEMKVDADAKNHSTTGDAIAVGKAMNAGIVFLTHFSQRYPKIPIFDPSFAFNTAIAFDLMCVRFSDLPTLPQMLPALKVIFAAEYTGKEADEDNSSWKSVETDIGVCTP